MIKKNTVEAAFTRAAQKLETDFSFFLRSGLEIPLDIEKI